MMTRLRSFTGALLAMYLLTLPNAFALTVQSRGFAELVDQAETIIVATVVEQRGAWGADGETIYTYAMLTDLDVIKGDVPAASFELRLPGGVIGDAAQLYPGMPVLEQGQRYVLFIRGNMRDLFPLVGVYQGLYRVLRDDNNQTRVLRYDQSPNLVARGLVAQQPTLEAFTDRIRVELISSPQYKLP